MKSRFLTLILIVLFIGLTNLYGCATSGVVKYDPNSNIGMNKELGKGVTVAILRFLDKRGMSFDQKKMIGTIYGGFKNPLKRIYSDKEVNLEVMDIMESLFSSNGYIVVKYPNIVDSTEINKEDLAVSGRINKFWSEGFAQIGAVVDINVQIFDTKKKEYIWNGNFIKFQEKGLSAGVFTSPDSLVSLLNDTLSDAIEHAWLSQGMLKTLEQYRGGEN